MNKWFDTDSWLYRKRYVLGYAIITLVFVFLLYIAGTVAPGGISDDEEKSFVKSASLDLQNLDTLTTVNLPFYAAQRGVLELFGVSTLSIKLLPMILAIITGIGAVFLLRRWFKPNIALLATIVMITTGQFLFVAQSGMESITYIMWPVWLLLTATLITTSPKHARFWKVLFFILVPLSLYTPLNIYLVLALISAGLLHPHVRYVLRRMSKLHLILLVLMSLVLVSPLAYLISRDPNIALQLLGLPSVWPPDLVENAKTVLQQYLNFVNPQSGTLMTPILGLGSILLIVLGIWRLAKIRYTARSYTLVAWVILIIPILLINPTFTTVAFVPMLILMASGLEFLLRSWYRMFPRNPYARFVGMVPLVILVGGLVISGLHRYYYGYRHDPVTASQFSNDLTLFKQKVKVNKPLTLVVGNDEQAFYHAVASLSKSSEGELVVTTTSPTTPKHQLAATNKGSDKVGRPIDKIITNSISKDSDRFYIYKTK